MSRVKRNKQKRIRRAAVNVIILCLLGLMLFAGWNIYRIKTTYNDSKESYQKIANLAADEDSVDFEVLTETNPDIKAWLRYDGTKIDYPVVMGKDNKKYLNTMFDGTENISGSLFIDCITEKPFEQFNTIIYGHHMQNGTMFGDLKKLREKKFCNKHPELLLLTPDSKYRLKIWAFLNPASDSIVYRTNYTKRKEMEKYIKEVRDAAEYTTDVEVSAKDKLVVLSTCAYEFQNARYVVVCKMEEVSHTEQILNQLMGKEGSNEE